MLPLNCTKKEILTCGWILPFSVTYQCLVAEISSITASTVTILQDTLFRIIFRDITPYVPRTSPILRETFDNVDHSCENSPVFARNAPQNLRETRKNTYYVAYFLPEQFRTIRNTITTRVSVTVNNGSNRWVNVELPATDDTTVIIKFIAGFYSF